MGTRCNILITDENENTLYFYRHYDGYPESIVPSLSPLLERLQAGELRKNVGQFSGHLILLGAQEMAAQNSRLKMNPSSENNWKCGFYEPTTGIHGDVAYIYTLDLEKEELTWEIVPHFRG